jgi:glycosyltransferase involved in cell wall biosynthesis
MTDKKVNVTVIIPTLNEELNLPNCLKPILNWAENIIIVDSNSTDRTLEIANNSGIEIVNFTYKGGWPKKRQYVLDTFHFKTEWILLLDADEILTEKAKESISNAIKSDQFDGYYLWFKIFFLNKLLRFSDPGMRKLSLFRTGFGAFEMRYEYQDLSMGDMEVHEHVVVKGRTAEIKEPIQHFNYNSLSRFILKHDQYSNYECKVHINGSEGELNSRFFGSMEQRRRYIKGKLIRNPIAPFFYFLYLYIFRMGFIDGRQGFYYILYQAIYLYFVNSKIYEQENIKTI